MHGPFYCLLRKGIPDLTSVPQVVVGTVNIKLSTSACMHGQVRVKNDIQVAGLVSRFDKTTANPDPRDSQPSFLAW